MSVVRELRNIQSTTAKPAWRSNALFIFACALAAGIAAAVFQPSSYNGQRSATTVSRAGINSVHHAAAAIAATKQSALPTSQVPDQSETSSQTDNVAPPMSFSYRGTPKFAAMMDFDFRIIRAEGQITAGTASRFGNFLKENAVAPGALVVLNSPGGSVVEAMELGEEIRKAGLSTSVRQFKIRRDGKPVEPITGCFSSCTLAFLGGTERSVAENALFGVHQISSSINLSPTTALQLGQMTLGVIVQYAAEMGVKAQFVSELTRAAPDGINILSQAQLRDLNVITPEFETSWNVQPIDGSFYLIGTTRAKGGLDQLIIGCSREGPVFIFMLNSSGRYMEDTLQFTTAMASILIKHTLI